MSVGVQLFWEAGGGGGETITALVEFKQTFPSQAWAEPSPTPAL